jgi:hypothetical protein
MSGAKHTPGPWLWVDGRLQPVIESNLIHTILDDSGTMVYRQQAKHSDDECLANRRLIGAAPDLLQALLLLMEDGHKGGLHGAKARAKARAAIAQATGSAA